jgi:hypothetical protein
MRYGETAEEELMRRDRARMKAKTRHAEHQQKETDPLLSHTAQVQESRRMPHMLPAIRAWWWRLFRWGTATPQHKALMTLCVAEVYFIEGVMSRWLVLPDILDEDLETDYQAILSRYQSGLIDYSDAMGDEDE